MKKSILVLVVLGVLVGFLLSFSSSPKQYITGHVTMYDLANYINCKSKQGYEFKQSMVVSETNILVIMEK